MLSLLGLLTGAPMLIIGDQKQNKKPLTFTIGEAIERKKDKAESSKEKRRLKSLIKQMKYPFS